LEILAHTSDFIKRGLKCGVQPKEILVELLSTLVHLAVAHRVAPHFVWLPYAVLLEDRDPDDSVEQIMLALPLLQLCEIWRAVEQVCDTKGTEREEV